MGCHVRIFAAKTPYYSNKGGLRCESDMSLYKPRLTQLNNNFFVAVWEIWQGSWREELPHPSSLWCVQGRGRGVGQS